jgi:large subunit ribosomal protein L35Ae
MVAKTSKTSAPIRLYAKGTVLGYKRAMRDQHPNHALVKIQGVLTKEDTSFYLGKRIAYVYKAKTEKSGSKFRCVWGKVTRHHGNGGTVRAKFTRNLPAKSFGGPVRIMLFPSRI